jgi:GGDEF domain-containing protein
VRAAERGFWNARLEMVAILDEESGLHTDWYFRLRLQEEIDRSERYNLTFSLLVIKPFAVHQDVDLTSAKAWFGDHIRRHLRKVDFPALLQDGSLAILMTGTTLRSARVVEKRVRKDLSDVDPRTGVACYPADGKTVDEIIAVATGAAASDVPDTTPTETKKAKIA